MSLIDQFKMKISDWFKGKILIQRTLFHGYPTDVILGYYNNHKILNGLSYPTDIQGIYNCSHVWRSHRRNGNILKYHMEVKNILLFHYYIMKMNYF